MPRLDDPAQRSVNLLYGFLLLQFICQAVLITPLGQARVWFRAAAFLSSLILFCFLRTRGNPHPARPLVLTVLSLTALSLLHPQLNTPLAGLAHLALTVAVWSPLLWATRIHVSREAFRLLILLLWGFNALSATIGVLQAHYPKQFMPDPEFFRQLMGQMASGQLITLNSGERIWRPMGLTDSPGGAAGSGFFSVVGGIVLLYSERSPLLRAAGVAGAVIGMFCIFVCQVRTMLVLTGLGTIMLLVVQVARGRTGRVAWIAAVAALIAVGGFVWAAAIGGEEVTARFSTLIEERADRVYYSNRGLFLEDAFIQVLEYPLGAGLGRWGMMNSYFGVQNDPNSLPLWAEIQISGWVYDGGLLLLVITLAAVVAVFWWSVVLTIKCRDPQTAELATLVVALNLATLANLFSYPAFVSQNGMIFCFLNAILYAAAAPRPQNCMPVPE